MSKPISILAAIIGALVLGCIFAYYDMQKYGTDFQAHPNLPVVILTDFFGASLSVMFFYFASRWLYRRKDRKLKGVREDKFYEEVARELQDKPTIPGLWTKAFAEMGGDDAKARALYIKYRVAQLCNEAALENERQKSETKRKEKETRLAIDAAKPPLKWSDKLANVLLGCFCGGLSLLFVGLTIACLSDTDSSGSFAETLILIVIGAMAFGFGFITYKCFRAVAR
jgi:hypothetical protein